MYRCADEKISKTENKVTVAYCDVENLDHQNWQLLEGKSYITSISIIKQKISYKNGVGSGFRRKIERDGGIQKKKRRESGIWEPLLWTLKGGGGCTQATALATFGLWHGMARQSCDWPLLTGRFQRKQASVQPASERQSWSAPYSM